MNTLIIIYGLSLGLALFAFLGYPFLMLLVAGIRKNQSHKDAGQENVEADKRRKPTVTVIVAAHNEEKSIAKTIESLLGQDYPKDKVRLMVFSDASTDRTDQIVKKYAEQGVELVRFDKNLGKTECQNRMVALTDSEVVAFADGNVQWEPQSLAALTQPFSNNEVAATTGRLVLEQSSNVPEQSKNVEQSKNKEEKQNEGLFRWLDNIVKRGESALLSTIGVDGPIYAVRRKDYVRLRPQMVSDLVLPVLLVAQGKKVKYISEALAREPGSSTVWLEFQRKRRMIVQGLVAWPTLWAAAKPWQRPTLFFMLASHKLLRWFGVELFILALAMSLLIIPHPVFNLIVAVELSLLGLAGLGLLLNRFGLSAGPVQPLAYFVLTNLASLAAKSDFVQGQKSVTWKTRRT